MSFRSFLKRWIPSYLIETTWNFRHYSLEEQRNGRVYFSQCGEDAFLKAFFMDRINTGQAGFYVDVGSFDPFTYSNTHLLYRYGWSGINIEPNPIGYHRFLKHRKRDINLQLAVSENPSKLSLSLDGATSSIVENGNTKVAQYPTVEVPALPLATILEKHLPSPETSIDFMDVDCEGYDMVVLRSNDWKRFRPKLILAEDLTFGVNETIPRFLESVNYRFLCRLHFTCIFVAAEFESSQPPDSFHP